MFIQLYSKLTHIKNVYQRFTDSKIYPFVLSLLLSWVYAFCSQIIIPLPFNLVPISLQPAPLFFAAAVFGWHAVIAYGMYLFQGALGLPFFAGLQGGFIRLFGPTGGYLFGFGLGMVVLAATHTWFIRSKLRTFFMLLMAWVITFVVGLVQLSFFVPWVKLLSAGLYPFIIGDFVVKLSFIFILLRVPRATKK